MCAMIASLYFLIIILLPFVQVMIHIRAVEHYDVNPIKSKRFKSGKFVMMFVVSNK